MTSEGYVRAVVSIHADENIDGPHIDYDKVKNVQIHATENYGETGTLQLVNNYGIQTENLLSNLCTLWSDGVPRKLDRGMFVRIYADERTEENAIGVYLMATIMVSDNLITVTFCDSVQYLRSVGNEYVRNHYESAATWHKHPTRWDSANNCGVIEHPANVTVRGGSYGDVKFFKKATTSNSGDPRALYTDNGDTLLIVKDLPDGVTMFSAVTVWMVGLISSCTVVMKIYHYNKSSKTKGPQCGEKIFNLPRQRDMIECECVSDFTSGEIDRTKYDSICVELKVTVGELSFRVNIGKSGGISLYRNGSEQDLTPENRFKFGIPTTNVEGQALTTTVWKINSVDGNSITQDEYNPNWLGKAQLFYVDTESRISADTIFNRILQAVNFTQFGNIGSRGVNMFRCNGDFIHNYLLALADMPDDKGDDIGRQYSFCSSPYTWNRLIGGKRSKKSDASVGSLFYAGDSDMLGAIPMSSFNPSISLKNHPKMAVAKGTGENDVPIMVALPDVDVKIGSSTTSVNSSITTPVEGALAVYSSIMTNRSEDWQGEIKLSGIHYEYFGKYGTVGGLPIRITDSRYGFLNYEAKVKEVVYDYANQTTTLTVNNYSEMYSNAILDTSKMAYSSGDMSAEASNKDMFCRQFIFMKLLGICPDDISSIKLPLNGSNGEINDAQKIEFPELNLVLLYGYFGPGNGVSTEQYGVKSVQIGNVFYPIYNESLWPDKYANQSLIVNMLFKIHE